MSNLPFPFAVAMAKVVIDTSMSASSENPVQNKVIYNALADKQDVIDATHKLSAGNVDDTSTTNKFVTSAEKSTWNGKQDALTNVTTAEIVTGTATTQKTVTAKTVHDAIMQIMFDSLGGES